MSVLGAAIISTFAVLLVTWHLPRSTLRKFVGYALWIDIVVHVGVIALFMGTSTLGLMQAELSAIFITIAIRIYRYLHGYSRLRREGALLRWRVTPGKLQQIATR